MITEGRGLAAVRGQACPSCGARLTPGPRGGASQNFYCSTCGLGWNLHGVAYGVIGYESIGAVSADLIELYSKKPEAPPF